MPDVSARRGRLPRLTKVNTEPAEPALVGTVLALNALMRPFTRRDWRDTEKLPRSGGLVVVANHISNVDPLALGQLLAYSGRWPRYLAKASLFTVPVMGRLLTACGQIPVERRTRAAADALGQAVRAVEAGKAVCVYPEGTITLDPNLWPMQGRTGAARIALQTGCPVVPVGQWGAQEIMYGKRIHFPKLLPPKTLRLKVGDPVPLDDLRAQPITPSSLKAATDRIMDALTGLVAELRAEPAPATRFDPRSADGGPAPRGRRG